MRSESASLAVDLPVITELPWAQRRLAEQLGRLQRGRLSVRFGDRRPLVLNGELPGPRAAIEITRPGAMLRRLFWRGDVGFAESYIAGDWRSDDLAGLLELLALNLDAYSNTDARHPLFRRLLSAQHRLRRNTRRGSRRNISAHYDLGNDFYAQWLDPSMTYSAALYQAGDSLHDAQQSKYARMLALTGARRDDHVLEIGCGWGGFAEYAARQGVRVTGLTLSAEQLAYAQRRIAGAGLGSLVDLRLCDYRDYQGQVDHIVSIEMFEAVGQAYWNDYFATLRRCLRPGGRAALQVITIDEGEFDAYASNPGGFIQRYIFPGGMLPTPTHLRQLGRQAGLAVRDMHRFGLDYARTLREWHDTFNRRTDWMEAHGYDKRFRRMWRYYLAFCEAGFRTLQIDVVHSVLCRE